MSRISGSERKKMDTVKDAHREGWHRNVDLLLKAQGYWDNLYRFRKERERCKRYNYGDQWGDRVHVGCEDMTEEAYIESQGRVPLKNNLIRRLVRNVLGVYRAQSKQPICTARDRDEQRLGETMSTILQCNWQKNRMKEVNARTFEEFLISGFIIQKKTFGWRDGQPDEWTEYVNPNNFFVDDGMKDFRGWDVHMLGEIHDVPFSTLCREFAGGPEDYDRLAEIYKAARERELLKNNAEYFGHHKLRNLDFLYPYDVSLCRVIEIWTEEMKPRYRCHDYLNGEYYKIETKDYAELVEAENASRLAQGEASGMAREEVPLIEAEWYMDTYWYYRFVTPTGEVLKEGETPYAHGSHPYVFKIYPFIDGEVHSFVSDVIDQQRYVNRLITLEDWMLRTSAKGVLMVPEQCLGDHTPEEFADEWTRYDGVIVYNAKPGVPAPQQVSANTQNVGIGELLNLQLKFFEDISGVQGALQGRPGYSQTSGALYAQQTQNSTMALMDLFDTFSSFVVEGAYKDVKNMQQFYDEKRVFNIAGKNSRMVEYDPEKISDVEFDLSIVEGTDTPVYRQMANELLMQIWQSGQISLEQLLENGDFPFADELLQSIQSQKEQAAAGGGVQALPQDLQQQVAATGNQATVQELDAALRGGGQRGE